MACILLTDSDRFPLGSSPARRIQAARGRLVAVAGHDPEAILDVVAREHPDAILVYHARFDASVIGRLDGVRVLGRCGTGYDRIDVGAARAAGIEVTYVPDYGVQDVADHTMALLLASVRAIVPSVRAVADGQWPGYEQIGPMHRLRGRTLGLLGFGRIARAVSERAAAFGMRVTAHDPGLGEEAVRAHGVEPLELDTLLRASDIVTVHVPLTARTRGLLDDRALRRMRPGAVLINTSRGEIVDEPALVSVLDEGRIAAVGLDVLVEEPPAIEHPLRRHPRVVVTPHTAAFTQEALSEVADRAVADVLRVLAGQPPRDPVPVS